MEPIDILGVQIPVKEGKAVLNLTAFGLGEAVEIDVHRDAPTPMDFRLWLLAQRMNAGVFDSPPHSGPEK